MTLEQKQLSMQICTEHKTCKNRDQCGGAQPHAPCDECGKCPFGKRLGAKCEEIVTYTGPLFPQTPPNLF